MPTSDEYRKTAEECYRLATEAKTEADRLACLDLARNWLDEAQRQEAMTPEQIAEVQKVAREWEAEEEAPQPKALKAWWERVLGLLG